jgi:hypothetical protein
MFNCRFQMSAQNESTLESCVDIFFVVMYKNMRLYFFAGFIINFCTSLDTRQLNAVLDIMDMENKDKTFVLENKEIFENCASRLFDKSLVDVSDHMKTAISEFKPSIELFDVEELDKIYKNIQTAMHADESSVLLKMNDCIEHDLNCRELLLENQCGISYDLISNEHSISNLLARFLIAYIHPLTFANRKLSLLGDNSQSSSAVSTPSVMEGLNSIIQPSTMQQIQSFMNPTFLASSLQSMINTFSNPNAGTQLLSSHRRLDAFGNVFRTYQSSGYEGQIVDKIPNLTSEEREQLKYYLNSINDYLTKFSMQLYSELPMTYQIMLLQNGASVDTAVNIIAFLKKTQLLKNIAHSIDLKDSDKRVITDYIVHGQNIDAIFALIIQKLPVTPNSLEQNVLKKIFQDHSQLLSGIGMLILWISLF